MIPVSLKMKNFLSYGEGVPALDFTEFSVACLSGNNGHGKSAILDAMTWALWGEARKAAGDKSPSEGLLRLGTSEMQVEFEFDLEGDRFRVLRNFQRKGKKSKVSRLEFQVLDESSNSYKHLTEKTARSTQGKINATLRMNYDTFINSAFILQGRVDEFTKKTPRKRKEILAEILDLLRYDQLVDLAKTRLREAEKQGMVLGEQLKTIKEELRHKPEYGRELSRLKASLEEVEQKQDQQTTAQQSLEKQSAELRGKQTQLTEKTTQKQQFAKDLESFKTRMTRQQRQISDTQKVVDGEKAVRDRYVHFCELQIKDTSCKEKLQQQHLFQGQKAQLEKTIERERSDIKKEHEKSQVECKLLRKDLEEALRFLARGQEIENGFRDLQTSRKQSELWEDARNEADNLQRQVRELEKIIGQRKDELSVELNSLARHIKDLQKLAEQEEKRAQELERFQKKVAHLEELEKKWGQNQEAGAECRALVDQLKNRRKELEARTQEAGEKLELLRRSETPQCPLCSSSLEGQKKDDLEEHFAHDIQDLYHEEKQLERNLKEEERRLKSLRTQYKELEKQIASHKSSREHLLPKAQNALEESQQAAKLLIRQQQQHDALQNKIRQKNYAQETHDQLKALQETLRALGYNKKEHDALRERLKTLTKFEGDFSKLGDARSKQRKLLVQLPRVEGEIAGFYTLLEQRNYAREEQRQLQELLAQIEELGYDKQAHAAIGKELQRLQNVPEQKAKVEQNKKLLPELQRTLEELLSEEEQKKNAFAQVDRQMHALSQELTTLPAVERELQDCRQVLRDLDKERVRLLQSQGTHQTKYDRCLQLEEDAKQKGEEKQQTDKDSTLYGHLVKIFGKDGIQAHLIESAFPEIEDKANNILARLTDNRTHITIESVKDLQSGKTKESLDIKISDELGTRSYEMYSGGESFRVDFAIRIALSKLLARRAGTRLKTLVIDEGFGTQDEQGLDQLVDAIKAIGADFEKILVITHLESLKNAFPVRIEVVKQPDIGSHYQVLH
ncbi:MAG: SMC family ATPase [bacterium]|nr:SMC family ATPase [bacterium]